MHTQTVAQSPKDRRGGGQISHLLLAPGQFGSAHLAVTLVEAAAGSRQDLHTHQDGEQVYVIVAGRGVMIVGREEREVVAGTLVFIPPGEEHAIHNPGPEQLVYVSATSPPLALPGGRFAWVADDDELAGGS